MVVYGDLLFIINFSMDFLCFYISCLLLHRRLPIARACLSASLGGVYSIISLFFVLEKGVALFVDIFVLIVMCLIVFLDKNARFSNILKGIFLYFFVSALLGGLMTALFSLFNKLELLTEEMGMDDGMDVWVFALLAIIGSFITLNGGKMFRSSYSKKTAKIEIESDIGRQELLALVDSGNLTSEPISGKSVVFASVEKCKNIIDSNVYDVITNSSNIEDAPLELLAKIRMIPTQAVSGKSFLPALRFKKVVVDFEKAKKEIDVYVALINDKILGEYDAIISDETII